jgi:hypothetical protein
MIIAERRMLSRKPNPMKHSGNCKHVSPEAEIWSNLRKHYSWHLLPPFKDKFDSTHWWVGQPTPKPPAALYELARRHPDVFLALVERDDCKIAVIKEQYGSPDKSKQPLQVTPLLAEMVREFADWCGYSEAVAFLVLFGLKSWPKLTEAEQTQWTRGAGLIKGVDCRVADECCYSIQEEARKATKLSPLLRFVRALEYGMAEQRGVTCGTLPPVVPAQINQEMKPVGGARAVRELEALIVQEAIRAYRKGHILIAASPELGYGEAARVLVKTFRNSQQLVRPSGKKRARPKRWLELIRTLEHLEPTQRVKSGAFDHYRRVIDGLHFPKCGCGY